MHRFYKISHAAEALGVSHNAIRKWADDGDIRCIRTPGGQRLIDPTSIPGYQIHAEKAKHQERVTILYSRVSSTKQKDDLQRQQQHLRGYLPDQPTRPYQEVSDVGSGLNFKRPGLLRVLGLVKEGRVHELVVASKDRLARFGFELIEWLCLEFGTKLIVQDCQDGAPEEELGKDLMAIVQVYCCRWNGRRRYKAKPAPTTAPEVQDVQGQVEPDGGPETDVEPDGGLCEVYVQQGGSASPR
jgi:putative resolvase